jgi:hypothetical protein
MSPKKPEVLFEAIALSGKPVKIQVSNQLSETAVTASIENPSSLHGLKNKKSSIIIRDTIRIKKRVQTARNSARPYIPLLEIKNRFSQYSPVPPESPRSLD